MEIVVNGEKQELASEFLNVRELLSAIGLDPEQTGIAVALNLSVVPRSAWGDTKVKSGDEIDVIGARQGG